MIERPILFSGPMVHAILDNKKTVTRRVAKLHSDRFGDEYMTETKDGLIETVKLCPYGAKGDRLWVRESFMKPPFITSKMLREGVDTWPKFVYLADEACFDVEQWKQWGWKSKPSIHMPREASRITLEVDAVSIERVQDITEEGAKAEGVVFEYGDGTMRYSFAGLWDSINEKRGFSWKSNPWVWVVKFHRL